MIPATAETTQLVRGALQFGIRRFSGRWRLVAAIAEAAMAEAAAMAAIEAECRVRRNCVRPVPQAVLDPFQTNQASVWNCLKLRFFLLHPARAFNI